MRQARVWELAMLATVVFMLAGCATAPAQTGTAAPAAPPPARTSTPAVARIEPRREVVVRDSTPSADALRVLEAIPEPLSPGQRVPPPPSTNRSSTAAVPRTPVRAPEAAFDTLRVGEAPVRASEAASDTLRAGTESDSAGVPVPSLTQPLGNGPGGALTMPDTLPPPLAAPPIADPVKPVVTPPSPAPSANEPCWRLQVAAPAEKPKAESRRDAAQSLLTVPFTIQFEKGLYKVRTRDCMTRSAVDALKRRAADSGFEGVFVVDTHAKPPAPVRKPAVRATPRKKARR